jgi:hypothetical protein
MLLREYFVLLLISTLMLGCAVPSANSWNSSLSSSTPAWVLNPEKPGYQSVTGSAPPQDWGGRSAQYRVAEMVARKELAQMVRVQIESTSLSQEELRAGKFSRDVNTETRLKSRVELSLESARVIEEWTDPQTGVLYIWMIVSK